MTDRESALAELRLLINKTNDLCHRNPGSGPSIEAACDLARFVRKNESLLLSAPPASADAAGLRERPYPIQDGPTVPWSVMAPHEAQCKRNHGGQALERIAERGGLGASEAYAIVHGIKWSDITGEMRQKWYEYAERVNQRIADHAAALARVEHLEKFKATVHDALDAMGIAKCDGAECRVRARLALVVAALRSARPAEAQEEG